MQLIEQQVIQRNDSGWQAIDAAAWASKNIYNAAKLHSGRNVPVLTSCKFSMSSLSDMLTYKAQLVGIQVIVSEESCTSKCSFLDLEPIGKHHIYRAKRGLFRASDGRFINADVERFV